MPFSGPAAPRLEMFHTRTLAPIKRLALWATEPPHFVNWQGTTFKFRDIPTSNRGPKVEILDNFKKKPGTFNF